jgi:hypothetical protein
VISCLLVKINKRKKKIVVVMVTKTMVVVVVVVVVVVAAVVVTSVISLMPRVSLQLVVMQRRRHDIKRAGLGRKGC